MICEIHGKIDEHDRFVAVVQCENVQVNSCFDKRAFAFKFKNGINISEHLSEPKRIDDLIITNKSLSFYSLTKGEEEEW